MIGGFYCAKSVAIKHAHNGLKGQVLYWQMDQLYSMMIVYFLYREVKLISLLVQCLCVVADSSHPTVLESTLPESLLVSLSQLFGIERADIQLNVMHLWHKMIDHNDNKTKVPFDTYVYQ